MSDLIRSSSWPDIEPDSTIEARIRADFAVLARRREVREAEAAKPRHSEAEVRAAASWGGTVVPLVEQPAPVDEEAMRRLVAEAISDAQANADSGEPLAAERYAAWVVHRLVRAGVLS